MIQKEDPSMEGAAGERKECGVLGAKCRKSIINDEAPVSGRRLSWWGGERSGDQEGLILGKGLDDSES